MNLPSHGSNPYYLYKSLNLQLPDEWIDFSANINPLGPPAVIKENWHQLLSGISDYPDPYGAFLKSKLAVQEGLEVDQIMIGNGGAEIIFLIGRLLAGKKAVIVQPAFSEYEEACRVNGCEVLHHPIDLDTWGMNEKDLFEKLDAADALFLCNPNNPTGVYFSETEVVSLLRECRKHDCLLILDEAFFDFLPDYAQMARYINEFPNLLLIRSMTKMFAIPGLRLGYVMGERNMIRNVARHQPQWSMNSVALQAGEWCLGSEEYKKESLRLIETEKLRLFDFYKRRKLEVSPSKVNFYLLRDPNLEDQMNFFLYLLKQGIIPRHTFNFAGLDGDWLRFAVRGPEENDILMKAVDEWLMKHD